MPTLLYEAPCQKGRYFHIDGPDPVRVAEVATIAADNGEFSLGAVYIKLRERADGAFLVASLQAIMARGTSYQRCYWLLGGKEVGLKNAFFEHVPDSVMQFMAQFIWHYLRLLEYTRQHQQLHTSLVAVGFMADEEGNLRCRWLLDQWHPLLREYICIQDRCLGDEINEYFGTLVEELYPPKTYKVNALNDPFLLACRDENIHRLLKVRWFRRVCGVAKDMSEVKLGRLEDRRMVSKPYSGLSRRRQAAWLVSAVRLRAGAEVAEILAKRLGKK